MRNGKIRLFSALSECLELVVIKILNSLDTNQIHNIPDPFKNMVGYYKKDEDWAYTAIIKEDNHI